MSPSSTPVVAIVDDDQRLLDSLRNLLESAGFDVHTFSSARALLESLRLVEIDCLVADVGMPGMDGFALRDSVRARRPGLPVILMTGRHEIAEQPRARSLADRFFRKPFDGQSLIAAIQAALKDE
jgi:FixJ family two-component response regulator